MNLLEQRSQSPSVSGTRTYLTVRSLGHIPAIKNKMYAIVDPRHREWKERCVKSLVSQLLSKLPTDASGTWTPDSLRSLIASLPQDDDWRVICRETVEGMAVVEGDEGADIMIERYE